MDSLLGLMIDLSILGLFLVGVRQFRTPEGALRGNLTAATAFFLAIVAVTVRNTVGSAGLVGLCLFLGSTLGWSVAARVSMVQIPAMVAFQHGAGGVAAFLLSFVELQRMQPSGVNVQGLSGIIGLVLGAATFSGSLVAAGKLAGRLKQTPTEIAGHNLWLGGTIAVIVCLSGAAAIWSGFRLTGALLLLVLASASLGVLVSIRIGGADMPVLISFLNATAGLAASFCGIVIGNRLLVASGATVAASGSVLTLAMCRAMNRNLVGVFRGFQPGVLLPAAGKEPARVPGPGVEETALTPLEQAVQACCAAHSVVVAPGYGMAMAGAQFEVVELGRLLEEKGKLVRFAIHPVAGRMPGHMYVLLAEAEVSYEKLCEPTEINPEFEKTDLALVVGASDVVNPAATTMSGTSISGMPILNVERARSILVINLDDSPGYSGVRNLLYDRVGTILMWGDAKVQLQALISALRRLPDKREDREADQVEVRAAQAAGDLKMSG